MTAIFISIAIFLLLIEILLRPRINSEIKQYYNEHSSSDVKPWYFKKTYYLWINSELSFSIKEKRLLLTKWYGKPFVEKQ